MIDTRGFALLTVLWVVAALGSVTAAVLAAGYEAGALSRNRILLTRAGWAREACLEILLGRYDGGPVQAIPEVDLGNGTRCLVDVSDRGGRANVNTAAPQFLRALFHDDSLVAALLDWRDSDGVTRPGGAERTWYLGHRRRAPRNGPLASPDEMRLLRDWGVRDEPLLRLTTTVGSGAINVNSAPPAVLAAIPQLSREAIARIMARRQVRQPISSAEELIGIVSRASRERILADYREFLRQTTFHADRITVRCVGWIDGWPLTAMMLVALTPQEHRLAVITRQVQ